MLQQSCNLRRTDEEEGDGFLLQQSCNLRRTDEEGGRGNDEEGEMRALIMGIKKLIVSRQPIFINLNNLIP